MNAGNEIMNEWRNVKLWTDDVHKREQGNIDGTSIEISGHDAGFRHLPKTRRKQEEISKLNISYNLRLRLIIYATFFSFLNHYW